MQIQFTDKHIEKIKEKTKTSTLRTIKKSNLYPIGTTIPIAGTNTKITIQNRETLLIQNNKITLYDSGTPLNKSHIAKTEGFNTYDELINWFNGNNPMNIEYNIPQPMYYYTFKPSKLQNITTRSDSDD